MTEVDEDGNVDCGVCGEGDGSVGDSGGGRGWCYESSKRGRRKENIAVYNFFQFCYSTSLSYYAVASLTANSVIYVIACLTVYLVIYAAAIASLACTGEEERKMTRKKTTKEEEGRRRGKMGFRFMFRV